MDQVRVRIGKDEAWRGLGEDKIFNSSGYWDESSSKSVGRRAVNLVEASLGREYSLNTSTVTVKTL